MNCLVGKVSCRQSLHNPSTSMSRLFNSCNVVAFRNHVNDTRRVIFATLYYGLQLLLVHHCIVDVVFTGILREAAEINLNIFADICVQFVR